MNIDDFIECTKEKARKNRYHASFFESDNPMNTACIKVAKDYEQLAEWLEKSKEHQQLEEFIGIPLKKLAEIFRQYISNDCQRPKKAIVLTDGDVDKWRKYRQLDKMGRLIKSPCKVGDIAYRINVGARKPIIPLRIVECSFKIVGNCIREEICCSDDCLCKQLSIIYYAEDIGDKVFLTKQEAEAKLKELRGGENEPCCRCNSRKNQC